MTTPPTNRNVTLRLPDPLMERVRIVAEAQKRGTSQQIEVFVEQGLAMYEKPVQFLPRASHASTPAAFFDITKPLVTRYGRDGNIQEEMRFENGPLLYLRIWPRNDAPPLTRSEAYNLVAKGSGLPSFCHDAPRCPDNNEYGAISYSRINSEPVILDAAQLFLSREIWAVNGHTFSPSHNDKKILFTADVERTFSFCLPRYLEFAREQLGLRSPFNIEAGAYPIKDFMLPIDTGYLPAVKKPVLQNLVQYKGQLLTCSAAEIEQVLAQIFEKFFDAAALVRPVERK